MNIIQKNTFRMALAYRREYDTALMQQLFTDPDMVMHDYALENYKNTPGDTSTVAHVHYDNRNLVIKRYNVKGLLHRIKRALSKSKARISWENADLLEAINIPSIKPVALIERKFGWFNGVAYLITEYQAGIMGHHYFADDSPCVDHFELTIHRISNLALQLRNALIVHEDFQFCNILISDHAPILLDLDHMKQFSKPNKQFMKAHQKDLDHFASFIEYSPVIHRIFKQNTQIELVHK